MAFMKTSAIIVVLYGLLCIIGGMIGYFKAGSFVSMIVGGIGGLLVLMCGILMLRGNKAWALVALIIALAFGIRFLGKYLHSYKLMPDLLMIIFSAVGALAALTFLFWKRKRPRARP